MPDTPTQLDEQTRPSGTQAVLVDDGTRVVVINRDKHVVTLPREVVETGEAAEAGYSLATPEQARERELEHQYGGAISTARSFLEGGARGMTMGMYDALAIAAGASPERLREEEARNPLAAGLGEAVGIIGPAFVPGGAALTAGGTSARGGLGLAKMAGGALARYSPAGILARTGMGLETTVAGGLARMAGQEMPGILAKAGAAAAVGAGEAAVYGVGETFSEAARLGDPELVGEMLVAQMKGNAVLGGSAAGIFSIATGAIGRGFAKAREFALGRRAVSEGSAEAEAIAQAQARARASGEVSSDIETKIKIEIDEGAAGKHWDAQNQSWVDVVAEKIRQRENAVMGGVKQDKLAQEITTDLTRAAVIRDELDSVLTMEGKIRGFRRDMSASPPAPVAETLAHARQKTLDVIEELESKIAEKDAYAQGTIGLLKPLVTRLKADHLKRLDTLLDTDRATAGGTAMGIIDDIKRRVDRVKRQHEKSINLSSEGRIIEELEVAGNHLRSDLENPDIWGQGAVSRQIGDNRAWEADLAHAQARRAWLYESVGTLKSKASYAEKVNQASYKNILGAVRAADSELESAPRIIRAALPTQSKLLKQLVKSHDEGPAAQALADEFEQITNRVLGKMDDAKGIATDMKGWERFLKQHEGGWETPRKLMVSGIASANQVARLNTIAQAATGVASRVRSLVKTVVDTGVDAAKAAKAGTIGGAKGAKLFAPYAPIVLDKTAESLKERFDRAIETDQQHQSFNVLHKRIVDVTDNIADVAPSTTMAMAQTASRASEFLRSKMPLPPIRPSDVTAHLSTRQRVSDSQMAKYIRYREGLDPIEAMDKLLASGQISREGAEAFRAVYPKMAQLVEMETMTQLAEATEAVPTKTLMHLSILLGRPLHPSMEPRYIALVQKMHKTRQVDNQPPQRQMPDMASQHASRSQQLA